MDPSHVALMGPQAAHTTRQTEPTGRRGTASEPEAFAQAYGASETSETRAQATQGNGVSGDTDAVTRETPEDAGLGPTPNSTPKEPLPAPRIGEGGDAGGDAPSLAPDGDKTILAVDAGGALDKVAGKTTGKTAGPADGALIGASTTTGPHPPQPQKAALRQPSMAVATPVAQSPDAVRTMDHSAVSTTSAKPSMEHGPLGDPAPARTGMPQGTTPTPAATSGRTDLPAGEGHQAKPPLGDGTVRVTDTGRASVGGAATDETPRTAGDAPPHGPASQKADRAPAVTQRTVPQPANLPLRGTGAETEQRQGAAPPAPDHTAHTAVPGAQKIVQSAPMPQTAPRPDGWRGQVTGKDGAKDAADDAGMPVRAARRANAPDSATQPLPRDQMPAPAQTTAHPAVAVLPEQIVPAPDAAPELTGGESAPGDAPRGERSLATLTDTGPPPRPEIGRSVSAQIADVIRTNGDGRIDVTLRPEDLGRLSLSFSSDGASMTVALTADRPETLDLIRRNLDLLEQELRDMGYETFQFDFGSDERRGDTGDGGDPAPPGQATDPAEGPADGPARAPAPVGGLAAAGSAGGMDLRL